MAIVLVSCSKPEASFTAGYAKDESTPTDISFKNKSKNCANYIWYFGNEGTSNEENPTHSFKSFGNVMVILEGKSATASDRDTQYINIPEPPRKKVKIETSLGTMVAELYNTTPIHRDNFLKLVNEGFFNDLLFHRTMQEFMIQGGDPDSKTAAPGQMLGGGGPGYTLPAEFGALHYKGSLAAARSPDAVNPQKASSGSQFYITQGRKFSSMEMANIGAQMGITYNEEQKKKYAEIGGYPYLDGQYTVFGTLLEGFDVLDKIAAVEKDANNRPFENVVMKISVIE